MSNNSIFDQYIKIIAEEEKHIVEEAHPESVYIAESRGDGGLVENGVEQQQKIVEIVNKMPDGTLVGRYAEIANDLTKIAKYCDLLGEDEAASLLVQAATKVKNYPFL